MTTKIPAWSYSSLTAYETCPRQYKLLKIDKVVPFKETEAIKHGNEVHKALELRIANKTPLPDKFKQYEPMAAKFDRPGAFAEEEIALDRNFATVGWWDKSCWVRGKIDVGIQGNKTVLLGDWKTGKVKPDSSQLELFAALKMTKDKTIERAKTMFIWLQHNKTTVQDIHRDDIKTIWLNFLERTYRLDMAFEKNKWPARPSGLCRAFCPVGKKHCEFCGSD